MSLQKTYETKLETAEKHEVEAILDFKLEATSPFGVADYVEYAVDNLDDKLKRIEQTEKRLKAIKVQIKAQIETIKIGASAWLDGAGLDKLQGDHVSSVTVLERSAKEDLIVTSEEALINAGYFKTIADKTAVKNAIKEGVQIGGAHIEITYLEDSLKINKKRSNASGTDKN